MRKPKPPARVYGRRFEEVQREQKEPEPERTWTCSCCHTHNNLGVYCRTCFPDLHKRNIEERGIKCPCEVCTGVKK